MLSRFNAGCDCDCCIVYKSEFCKNWYESVFERKYFGSIDGNPSRMNLNGGTFDQLGVLLEEGGQFWEIRNDACGSGITSCETSTDSKGWKYSADHYLTPTGNVASSYLSTLHQNINGGCIRFGILAIHPIVQRVGIHLLMHRLEIKKCCLRLITRMKITGLELR
jgi:hypothetical protein